MAVGQANCFPVWIWNRLFFSIIL